MENPSVIFGENCFDDSVMQNRLPKETYKALRRTIEEGRSLDPSLAGVIANAMKDWALEKGATHYTPLVPAHDRRDRRKARLLHRRAERRQGAV